MQKKRYTYDGATDWFPLVIDICSMEAYPQKEVVRDMNDEGEIR